MNEKIKNLLKVTVSITLFSLVVYYTGPSKIWKTLKDANLILYIPVLFLGILNISLSSKKLQILLQKESEDIGYGTVLKNYFIGSFFNQFLPTSVGGDFVKAHRLSDLLDRKERAWASVFMERYLGLTAIITLASISVLIYFAKLPTLMIGLVFLLYIPGLSLSVLLITRKSLLKKLKFFYDPLLGLFEFINLKNKLKKIYISINQFKKRRKTVLYALTISYLFQFILITNQFILSKAVGMEIPFYYFFIIIPICQVLLFLPISIRGWGVKGVLYVFFFGQIGTSSAQAFSLSFLGQIHGLILSGIGGLVYLYSKIK